MKTIYIGSDHAGFALKEKITKWLQKQNIPYQDVGAHTFDKNDDYPDYAKLVSKAVVQGRTKGILLCGSAEGMCIAANKMKGIRAVNPSSAKLAQLSREHNDANVLCLSGWFFSSSRSKKIITTFLNTKFSNKPRHKRRIQKIKRMER